MPPAPPDSFFRAGLLEGHAVGIAGAQGAFGFAVARACAGLGADVVALRSGAEAEGLAGRERLEALVVDASAAAQEPADSALDGVWNVVRAAATVAMIPEGRGGKVVLVAPAPDGAAASAARAGLENMARTLSIEWARYGIRVVAIHPRVDGDTEAVSGLVAFLASEAGDYFSGCVLSLGAVDRRRRES
jgi:NAD(P)-dependent dehydrogenase (short-subunit alcohol dehydrogenase family)